MHGGGPDYEGEDLVSEDEEDTALFPMDFEGQDFAFIKDNPDFGVADLPSPRLESFLPCLRQTHTLNSKFNDDPCYRKHADNSGRVENVMMKIEKRDPDDDGKARKCVYPRRRRGRLRWHP